MNSRNMLAAAGIGLAAVAFAAGYAFNEHKNGVDNSPNPTPSATGSPPAATSAAPARVPMRHTVRLTVSGPVPKTLTIVAGDQVTFVSETQSEYWPASQACPDLNARRGLRSGDMYALAFSVAGTCDYYNHLDPHNGGQQGSIVIQ